MANGVDQAQRSQRKINNGWLSRMVGDKAHPVCSIPHHPVTRDDIGPPGKRTRALSFFLQLPGVAFACFLVVKVLTKGAHWLPAFAASAPWGKKNAKGLILRAFRRWLRLESRGRAAANLSRPSPSGRLRIPLMQRSCGQLHASDIFAQLAKTGLRTALFCEDQANVTHGFNFIKL